MAEFDTITKDLVHTWPRDFARLALRRDDLDVLDVLDTEQPTIEARRADSLIRVRIEGEEALVHYEFQTADSDPPMPRRMAGYLGRAVERYGLPVYGNVLYLRPGAGRSDPGRYEQARPGYRVLLQYRVMRLSELAGQAVLETGALGWLPLAPLMRRPSGLAPEAWLRRCVQRAQAAPLAEARKVDYLAELAILSGLVYTPESIMAVISEETMYESSIVQYFTEKGIKQGMERGMEQGMERGMEQGMEQGGRQRAVEDLLDVLEIRFGLVASDPLAVRLRAIGDVQRLTQLHRAAIQAPDLDAFRGLVGE